MKYQEPKPVTATGKEFFKRREEVIEFIKKEMVAQGATLAEAVSATVAVEFFKLKDVENLYRCINSGLPENVIKAIVAHDFNGLARKEKGFLPKSTQFEETK